MSTFKPNIITARLNVLVYSGFYAVTSVTTSTLLHEPWMSSCALLVIPGGRDVPYCQSLNGLGNKRISQFVKNGGSYLGLCAGGYYASARCEFEVDDPELKVVGDRELGFFPGVCRGSAFKGFKYASIAGARAVRIAVNSKVLQCAGGGGEAGSTPTESFRTYYNGGGVFVDALRLSQNISLEVIATYDDGELDVDGGCGKAAVVFRRFGHGSVILSAVHPEYDPSNIDLNQGGPKYADLVGELVKDDEQRIRFLKACLVKLGLRVAQDDSASDATLTNSELHLSGIDDGDLLKTINALNDIAQDGDGDDWVIRDELDTLRIVNSPSFTINPLRDLEPRVSQPAPAQAPRLTDPAKTLLIHQTIPTPDEIPSFNHETYYSSLYHYRQTCRENLHQFGSQLIYAKVLPSTQTILEKNPRLLSSLPIGLTVTTSLQVAGRGRGSNVWVGSRGQLSFSTVIRHPASAMAKAPVVFVQYLAAMAVVQGIKGYDKGYERVPIKMKWPNDIYALDPTNPGENMYTKITGILVNATSSGKDYIAISGIGINVLNTAPTTSLAMLVDHLRRSGNINLAELSLERLLASILTRFESLHARFLRTGFDTFLEQMYYDSWLHTDQIVTLETEGGVRAKIRGITRDYGFLKAEELGGLVRRKM
ncbi:biotin holocarboxylase synthetase [Ascosphaera aggregata]|nr:biotin holocarboxylase synthetase [Ascosphaera aggregata]